MNKPRTSGAGEELVFPNLVPWRAPTELRTYPATTLMFGYLADTRRFVRATHVHLELR